MIWIFTWMGFMVITICTLGEQVGYSINECNGVAIRMLLKQSSVMISQICIDSIAGKKRIVKKKTH